MTGHWRILSHAAGVTAGTDRTRVLGKLLIIEKFPHIASAANNFIIIGLKFLLELPAKTNFLSSDTLHIP